MPLFLAVIIVASGAGCAHRGKSTTTTSATLNPLAPPRDIEVSQNAQRAGESVDRLRRSIQDRKAAPVESRTEFRPTDNAAPSAQPTGTSWSVIVGSAPPVSGNTQTAPQSTSAESAEARAPEPVRRGPWQHRLNIVGGLLGALCCVLALRKRARESSVDRNDLAA